MRRPNRWMWSLAAAITLGLGFVATMPRPAALAADNKDAKADAKPDARKGATFEVYKDRGGEYRWRLRTTNKQIIATSGDGYKEKRDCLAGIESVKRNAADAKVEEQSGS